MSNLNEYDHDWKEGDADDPYDSDEEFEDHIFDKFTSYLDKNHGGANLQKHLNKKYLNLAHKAGVLDSEEHDYMIGRVNEPGYYNLDESFTGNVIHKKNFTKRSKMNEVSDQTLRNYVKRAEEDYEEIRKIPTFEASPKADRDFDNRATGINLANEKLNRKGLKMKNIYESQASDTLDMYRSQPSRADVLNLASQIVMQMPPEDLSGFYEEMLAQIGNEGSVAGLDQNAQYNAQTIMMKPSAALAESLNELFGDEASSEFTQKVATLNEAYLNSQILQEKVKLNEEFQEKEQALLEAYAVRTQEMDQKFSELLAESTVKTVDFMAEKIDSYLSYVAEKWLEENREPIESNVKQHIMENMIGQIQKVFVENNLDVTPEESSSIDVLAEHVAKLEATIQESREAEQVLFENNRKLQKKLTIEEAVAGLNPSEAEQFRRLAESADLSSDFRTKLGYLKESIIKTKSKSTGLINEEKLFDQDLSPLALPNPEINTGWRNI